MSANDLTIIYVTLNKHPKKWKDFHKKQLLKAAGNTPIITISPVDVGIGKWVEDKGPYGHEHMYKMVVEVAKTLDTTYIAVAEDDTLYSPDHFDFRPGINAVSYNMHRWSLYTWTGLYSDKNRISNCGLIADRLYYIDAWEERWANYPEGLPPHRVSEIGRNNQERWMGVTERNCRKFYSNMPIVQLNHPNATDSVGLKKRMGHFRASDIPYWGPASGIIENYE